MKKRPAMPGSLRRNAIGGIVGIEQINPHAIRQGWFGDQTGYVRGMNRKKHRRFGFFLALAGLCFIPLQSAFALSIAYPREHDWTFHFLGNEYGIYEQKMDHGLLLSRPSNPSYSTYTRVMINGKQVWSIKSRFEWVVGGFFGVLIAGGILIGVGGGTLRQLVRDRAFNGEKKPEAIP